MLASHNLHAAPPTILDYFATSGDIHRTHSTEVQEEAAHTIAHQPLWLTPGSLAAAGWREAAPGQLEALLTDWKGEHRLTTIHKTLAPVG